MTDSEFLREIADGNIHRVDPKRLRAIAYVLENFEQIVAKLEVKCNQLEAKVDNIEAGDDWMDPL